MSQDCLLGEIEYSLVDRKQVDVYAGVHIPLINRAKPHPQVGRLADVGHHFGRGDQGLGGNAVGKDRRAAEAVGVDKGDLAAQLAGHQRCLVAARTSADNHHPGHASRFFHLAGGSLTR